MRKNMFFAILMALIASFTVTTTSSAAVAKNATSTEYTGQIVDRFGQRAMAVVFPCNQNYTVRGLYYTRKWGTLYDNGKYKAFEDEVARLTPGIVFNKIPCNSTVYFPVPKGMQEEMSAREKSFASITESAERIIDGLKQAVADLTKKVGDLTAALFAEQNKNLDLTEKLVEKERWGGHIATLLREVNEQYDNLLTRLMGAEKQIVVLKDDLDRKNHEVEKLKHENSELVAVSEELSIERDDLFRKALEANDEVTGLKTTVAEQAKSIDDLSKLKDVVPLLKRD